MCVDCAKVELVRKDDAVYGSHAHMHGVRVRAADRNDVTPADQKFVPASQGFRHRTIRDKLREVCIECSMQFGGYHGFEFTQSVPELDPCKALHIPGFP